MSPRVVGANEARSRFRDLVDQVSTGTTSVIIQRYGKRLVAMIPYADYEACQAAIEEQRLVREAEAELAAWRRDRSRARPYDEARAEMVSDRLLDE